MMQTLGKDDENQFLLNCANILVQTR